MKSSIDGFRQEAEIEATLHQQLAQQFSEELQKLTDFREKQRDERKKIEDHMHRVNKHKGDLYRRMSNFKNVYEAKCKIADKSEVDADKLKYVNKPREVERSKKQAQQSRNAANKADDDYRNSVITTEAARSNWVKEHIIACDKLQRMEEDRIRYLRNLIWIFANLGSDFSVKLDNSRESIRLITEKCDHVADIREVIVKKSTCIAPLQPVKYSSYYINEEKRPSVSSTTVYSCADDVDTSAYEHIEVSQSRKGSMNRIYQAIYAYQPNSPDELEFLEGDLIECLGAEVSGWFKGSNKRTKKFGLVPFNYVNSLQ